MTEQELRDLLNEVQDWILEDSRKNPGVARVRAAKLRHLMKWGYLDSEASQDLYAKEMGL